MPQMEYLFCRNFLERAEITRPYCPALSLSITLFFYCVLVEHGGKIIKEHSQIETLTTTMFHHSSVVLYII